MCKIFQVILSGQSPVELIRTTFWFPIKTMINKKEEQILYVVQPRVREWMSQAQLINYGFKYFLCKNNCQRQHQPSWIFCV